MPLVKSASKEAFRKNVAAEIRSGKKPAQAVAIAYSVKREAAKSSGKKNHLAKGDKKPSTNFMNTLR
jgi:hypothetical protein